MISTLMKLTPLLAAGVAMGGGSEEMKKLGEEVVNVVKELKTTSEMGSLAKMVYIDLQFDEGMPQDIAAYARENMDSQGTDPGVDSWGTEWQLYEEDGAYFIQSCGADETCGSDDDHLEIIVDSKGRRRKQY